MRRFPQPGPDDNVLRRDRYQRVLVSALLNINSNPGAVLLSIFHGETVPLLNEEILAEYQNVLSRKKFHLPAETVDVILRRMAAVGLNILTADEEYPEVGDPKDRCFYTVPMTGRQTGDVLLITGNIRHFPSRSFVVTPAQFIEILRKNKQG